MARAEGSYLWDRGGRRYLDFYAGHAVAGSGHCHPRVVAAIREQAEKLIFYSSALRSEPRERLLRVLGTLTPPGLTRAFFVNSGAEANEQALALARRRTGRSRVVCFEGAFHGRTLATLVLAGLRPYRASALASAAGEALGAFTRRLPWNDAAAARAGIDEEVAAVIVEPVQGLAGARVASPEFLQALREACDAAGAVLIFDEVQSGCLRCGGLSAGVEMGVQPDLLTLAKGIAAGLPLGAVLATTAVCDGLSTGDLGSTFGGAPIPCAAAAANLAALAEEGRARRALEHGRRLADAMAVMPGVVGVEGRGLLMGVRLDRPVRPVIRALFASGVLTGTSADPDVLRLLPPLVIDDSEIELFLRTLKEVLESSREGQ
ncbi:MAG: aminotransferase class III-fold pyridoxal phosphate-dependent enzyme [Acidobacteriota bacterium]|nr:aminotransferase class III-fold pyridoxal phosphate-dependent enzyme [Acidobacteriota bacterium]